MTDKSAVRILAVDDRPQELLTFETVLNGHGYEIVTAANGAEALRCVLEQDFAVILLDVNMPDMDGFEVASFIRQRERSAHTPIIFVTGTFLESSAQGYQSGAVDYLIKPYSPEILKAKVAIFVELFEMREKIKQQAVAGDLLNQQLRQHIVAAERLNQDLDAFARTVSHDLRAPARNLSTYAQTLLEEHATGLDAEAKEILRRMGEITVNMNTMIDGLLSLSSVSRSELQSESVNLSDIAAEIASELRHLDPTRKVEIIFAGNLSAQGDPRLLQLVLKNLLDNAWKFTSKREDARIEFGEIADFRLQTLVPEAKRSGNADLKSEIRNLKSDFPNLKSKIFFVKDNGAGFNPAYADKLFIAFNRLHTQSEFPGSGIGLATVARIIQRHNGKIWAESEVDKGAVFYFTIGSST